MIGQQVLHYRIVGELGRGGMGVVYEAEDTRLGRHVALKFLPERHLSADALERFHREARLASSLSHPHICALYDVGIEAERPFIVMELLEGETIRQRLTGRSLATDLIIEVACQLADALDAAHGKGVVHRDIKPANVFITKRGHAKLLDFGVAKLVAASDEQGEAATAAAADSLTNPGVAIGSVHYMSPEQARGEDVDARTDLFSLGLVLYEMATGRQAFQGQTTLAVLDALLREQPPAPRGINPSLPPELDRIIVKSIEKDRRLRYQSAADLQGDLVRLRRDSTASHTAVAPAAAPVPVVAASAPARRLPWKPLVAATALVVVAAAGFFVWWSLSAALLTDRDTILVADFVNTTGDTDFDGTLRQGLLAQLQQSPFLLAISDSTITNTLKFMDKPADTPVVGAIAREACQRTQAKATVEGTIAKVGASFVVTLEAINCQTGDVLARQQKQADGKERVLETLGSLTAGFRTALGESAATVRQYDVPLAQATTSSLEALKAYSLAIAARTKSDAAARPLLERAVEIDPTFAMAQARLATVAGNLGDNAAARDHAAKAYALRDRVGEYEQFYISAKYQDLVMLDSAAFEQILNQAVATFPRSPDFCGLLGLRYRSRGDHEKAIPLLERWSELEPGSRLALESLLYQYALMEDREKFYGAAERILKLIPDHAVLATRVYMAALSGDSRLDMFLRAAENGSSAEQLIRMNRSLALMRGQLHMYDELGDRLMRFLSQRNDEEGVAELAGNNEVLNVSLGRPPSKTLESASMAKLSGTSLSGLAWAFALQRDTAMARRFAGEVDHRRSGPAPSGGWPIGMSRAAALFAAGRLPEPRAVLDQAAMTAGRNPTIYMLRGRVRQVQGDVAGARDDYRVYLQRRYVTLCGNYTPTTYPPAGIVIEQTQMIAADLARDAGDLAEARRLYEALLLQWKDADADFPLLVQVKDRLAKLGK
jgi:tetratricopeptide (TPR) repeat protein